MTTTPAIAEFTPGVDDREHSRHLGIPAAAEAASEPADAQSPELEAQSPELTTGAPDGAVQPVELSEEDKADRLWWDKVEVLGKIKDCSRMITEVESEIDEYQDQIKEAKEVLKGQQALLTRYSSQLADIMDGHPLPRNPKAAEATKDGAEASPDEPSKATEAGRDWRDLATEELLAGIKGLGAKKLDAIVELAPTAGKLEDLRGEASMSYKQFKEVLPKGCGESMADEIEKRLEEHIRDWTRNQPDEPEAGEASAE